MRGRILVIYPNEYSITDSEYEVYHVNGHYMRYIGSCYNEVIARWTVEDMEKLYDTEYITIWTMRKSNYAC